MRRAKGDLKVMGHKRLRVIWMPRAKWHWWANLRGYVMIPGRFNPRFTRTARFDLYAYSILSFGRLQFWFRAAGHDRPKAPKYARRFVHDGEHYTIW